MPLASIPSLVQFGTFELNGTFIMKLNQRTDAALDKTIRIIFPQGAISCYFNLTNLLTRF